MNVSFLQVLLNNIAEQGRSLLPWGLRATGEEDIIALSRALVSVRGEASGVVIARQILNRYRTLTADERRTYFRFLAEEFRPAPGDVAAAARAYLKTSGEGQLARLQAAVESPRQEFFRRLNLAPGATAEIVAMRKDLLREPRDEMPLDAIDADLRHLLGSWFNRGFLVLQPIGWRTPAVILEKIIEYEAVHEIQGWEDLRRRLEPADRRCFAFFHPSLIDEPLIFVEVALMSDMPQTISRVLRDPKQEEGSIPPTTAVFYSISNCQEGLKGISFGNFLIKQVVEDLAREQPSLKSFVTLSPAPTFARWLDRVVAAGDPKLLTDAEREALQALHDPHWVDTPDAEQAVKPVLLSLAAHYFLRAKSSDGKPIDPVARFHLGNGARLERINWLADRGEKGLREAHGLMVNYSYDLKDIERNHEAYANEGVVATSRAVRSLLPKTRERVYTSADRPKLPTPDPELEPGSS